MVQVQKHLEYLGLRVKDKVSGFEGVITSVSFDLYGCIQVIVHPGTDKDGKLLEPCWFDIARLEVLGSEPVMDRPNFEYGLVAEGKKGPAEKPRLMKS